MGNSTEYDEPSSCNFCGGNNEVTATSWVASNMCEAETECTTCGRKDYWAYGFFESSIDGHNKSKKYSFNNDKE